MAFRDSARSVVNDRVSFTSVEFRNFKAFERLSITLQDMNVLVGPNNSGKSTIIGAFRVLAAALRRGRAKSAERVTGRKRVEYRAIKPYWRIKLGRIHPPFLLRLINGMSPVAPQVTVEGLTIRENRKAREFELHLGRIISVKHWDHKREQPRPVRSRSARSAD